MAQITISIPDEEMSRVTEAFANVFGWSEAMGTTVVDFTQEELIKFIKQTIKTYEVGQQISQSKAAIEDDIEKIIIT